MAVALLSAGGSGTITAELPHTAQVTTLSGRRLRDARITGAAPSVMAPILISTSDANALRKLSMVSLVVMAWSTRINSDWSDDSDNDLIIVTLSR